MVIVSVPINVTKVNKEHGDTIIAVILKACRYQTTTTVDRNRQDYNFK